MQRLILCLLCLLALVITVGTTLDAQRLRRERDVYRSLFDHTYNELHAAHIRIRQLATTNGQ